MSSLFPTSWVLLHEEPLAVEEMPTFVEGKPRGGAITTWNCCECYTNNDVRWHPSICNRASCQHPRCSACTTTTTYF